MRWRHSGVSRDTEFKGCSHTTTTHQTLKHWRSLMEEMRLCRNSKMIRSAEVGREKIEQE